MKRLHPFLLCLIAFFACTTSSHRHNKLGAFGQVQWTPSRPVVFGYNAPACIVTGASNTSPITVSVPSVPIVVSRTRAAASSTGLDGISVTGSASSAATVVVNITGGGTIGSDFVYVVSTDGGSTFGPATHANAATSIVVLNTTLSFIAGQILNTGDSITWLTTQTAALTAGDVVYVDGVRGNDAANTFDLVMTPTTTDAGTALAGTTASAFPSGGVPSFAAEAIVVTITTGGTVGVSWSYSYTVNAGAVIGPIAAGTATSLTIAGTTLRLGAGSLVLNDTISYSTATASNTPRSGTVSASVPSSLGNPSLAYTRVGWQITNVTTTTFDLVGSVGDGTFTPGAFPAIAVGPLNKAPQLTPLRTP